MKEIASAIFPWKYYVMVRRKETALCRLRIGHTRLTHGFLMSRDPPPYCEDCLVLRTVRHLLVECPSLTGARDRFLTDCKNAEGDYVLDIIIVCIWKYIYNFILARFVEGIVYLQALFHFVSASMTSAVATLRKS